MGIIYIITILLLNVSFILVEKSNKKISILSSIVTSIGITLCFNSFISYVLTFLNIPITLLILSIINIILCTILGIKIIKNKKIQKFEFHKLDFLYSLIIVISIFVITLINNNFINAIKYETADSAIHCFAAQIFSENEMLSIKNYNKEYMYGSDTIRIGSYVNTGIIMKCFKGVIDDVYCYKIFIMNGIIILTLTGLAMYFLLSKFAKNNKHRLIAFIISMLYVLGYPLNSYLFGFEYLSTSLFLIVLIFNVIYYFDKDSIKLKYFIPMLFLLNFTLFHSYYMFVTFMYPAQFIYFCIKEYDKNNKIKSIINKKNVIILTLTLIVPFLLGYIYYMEPQIYRMLLNKEDLGNIPTELITKNFAGNGYIYVNFISNILLLLPLPIYLITKELNENRFSVLSFIFCLLFIFVLILGFNFKHVSEYYLSKNYFVLWFILWYLNYKAILLINDKYPKIINISLIVYIILIAFNITNSELINHRVYNKNNLAFLVELYGTNYSIISNHEIDINEDNIELIKYFKNNIDYNNKVEFICHGEQYCWIYNLSKYVNKQDKRFPNHHGQSKFSLKAYFAKNNLNNVDYIVFLKNNARYEELKNIIFEKGDIIYENASGGIIKCK